MEATQGLRVRVLGRFVVEGYADRELHGRKGRTLLKVLALARGAPLSAERLAEALWGDDQPSRPGDQVGVLVSRLRGVLGADRLPRADAGYSFLVDWLDVDELAARAAEAKEALSAGRLGSARAAAEAALTLARGPVLPDEDGSWVEPERASADSLVSLARWVSVEAALAAGDGAAAVAMAEQALARDPYDESMLRALMGAHASLGRPASALAAYVRTRDRLVEDFGVDLSAETEALHDALVLADQQPPAPGASSTAAPPLAAPPLVGRAPELALLDEALERSRRTTRPVVVEISGEPGIGKTALVEGWLARTAPPVLALVGRCDELGRDLPLAPVAEALNLDVAELADTATAPGPVDVPVEAGRAALFGALTSTLQREAAGRPTVVVIEDVHLADPSTMAFLAHLCHRPLRLLVVLTARPGPAGHLPSAQALRLGPLDTAAVAELVGAERAEEVFRLTGGLPLLIEAVANLDPAGPGRAALDVVVERRVAGLGPAAVVLRAAAVLGPEVDLDLLAEVLRTPALEVLECLEGAADHGLLVERRTGFAFRHELERSALDRSVSSARRAFLHRDAARTVAERSTPDPLAVAVHARLGGEDGLAARWYVTAGLAAAARYDLDAAEAHLGTALALDDDAAAWEARARVRMAARRFDAAAADAAEAVARNAGASALEAAGWIAYYRRRYDEALLFADAGAAAAEEGEALRVSCLALGARVRHGSGELGRAGAALEAAVAAGAPAEITNMARVWLSHVRLHVGRPDMALDVLRPVLAQPDRVEHPFAALHGRFARVVALGQLGRVGDALAACDDFDRAVERAGEQGLRLAPVAHNCRAWLLRWSGHLDGADEQNTAALDLATPAGLTEAHFAALLDLGSGCLLRGDREGAGRALEQLTPIEEWQGTMAWHQRHRWWLLRAQVALHDGDRATALALSEELVADAAERGARRYELLGTAVQALAGGRAAGQPERLDGVVAGLDRCAALDGWPLVAALGGQFDTLTWREAAARQAAALVRSAPDRSAAAALVTKVLG